MNNQFKGLFFTVLFPSILVYVIILRLSILADIEPGLVLRDLIQTCNYPIGVGMISNLGVLLWAGAAAVTSFVVFSGLVKNSSWNLFLKFGAYSSMLLCLDDFFLLHDRYISQDILYSAYVIFGIYLLSRFRGLILSSSSISFLAAIFFLGLSVISDIFQDFMPVSYETVQIFEEAFKFLGISCWLSFWSLASLAGIKKG